MTSSQHVYEVRPRTDKRGVDLISDALPFGRLWYGEPNAVRNAIGYAMQYSRSRDAVVRVYDDAGNVIETHEHKGDFPRAVDYPVMAILTWRSKEIGSASLICSRSERGEADQGASSFFGFLN